MKATMAPSEELRAAISAHYSPLATEHWQNLVKKPNFDWEGIVNEAFANGLAPLLYFTIRNSPEAQTPAELLSKLRQSYYRTASYNAVVLHDLQAILKCLGELPIVLLKGTALLQSVYKDIAFRPMTDIDLLLPFDTLSIALESLNDLGYELQAPFPFENINGLYWNEAILVKKQMNSIALELHWQLLDIPYYASRMPVDTLISRAIPYQVENMNSRILAPDDQVLHLCSHNYFHHQGGFQRTVVDVAFIIRNYHEDLDWDRLVKNTINNDMISAVKTTLIQVSDEWYTPIPHHVRATLQNRPIRLRETLYATGQRSEYLKVFRTLLTLPGLTLKWHFLLGQLFPNSTYVRWRYGIKPGSPKVLAYLKRFGSGLLTLISDLPFRRKGDNH